MQRRLSSPLLVVSLVYLLIFLGCYGDGKWGTGEWGTETEECQDHLRGEWYASVMLNDGALEDGCEGHTFLVLYCGNGRVDDQVPCVLTAVNTTGLTDYSDYDLNAINNHEDPFTTYSGQDLIGSGLPTLCTVDTWGNPDCTIFDAGKTMSVGLFDADYTDDSPATIDGTMDVGENGDSIFFSHHVCALTYVYTDPATFVWYDYSSSGETWADSLWTELEECVEATPEDTDDTGGSETTLSSAKKDDDFYRSTVESFLAEWHETDALPGSQRRQERVERLHEMFVTYGELIPGENRARALHTAIRLINLYEANDEARQQMRAVIEEFENENIDSIRAFRRMLRIHHQHKPKKQE